MDFRTLANLLATPIEYGFDTLRAFRWSKASPLCPKEKQVHYDIILLAHTVEKGLSISNPRKKFGVEKITMLLHHLSQYDEKWGVFPLEKAYGCLNAYVEWHEEEKFDLGDFGKNIKVFLKRCKHLQLTPRGGVKDISLSEITPDLALEDALNRRASCRRFLLEPVSGELIDRVAKIATRTPSQCNRQSSRIHYYSDREQINELLKLQGGAEGFRESIYNLFVITSEMSAWSGVKARSQSYVDASLTSMQVLNACQSLGLGTCPLSLAVTNSKEKAMCKVGNISTGERLVLMIVFGHPEKIDLIAARSERMPINEVLINH
jgi:nitroreductase